MPRGQQIDAAVACLWVLTPLATTLSVAIVCVAMATSQWLHTEEKMNNPNYNGTGDKEYLLKSTVSGLWTLCYTNPGYKDLNCFNIDYFPKEEYSPDPNDSTMSIPYAVTKSALFFFLATALLAVSESFCLYGHFATRRRIFTFVSGVISILSGLLMLIGLVMYISIFKAEIGNKLRSRSPLQPPIFTFRYGFSFLLVVAGFMSSELAGISAIFLYIYWHHQEWDHTKSASLPSFPECRRHPRFHTHPPPPPQIHRAHFGTPPPILQRRFYLDNSGDTSSRCSRNGSPCLHRYHHRQELPAVSGGYLSNSMRDVSVATSYYSFPPAPSGVYHHYDHSPDFEATVLDRYHHHGSKHQDLSGSRSSFFPRDATTNTVSTTADINNDDEEDEDEAYSPSLQHENEFVTFDLDETPMGTQLVAVRGDEHRRREFAIDTLRRTTPV